MLVDYDIRMAGIRRRSINLSPGEEPLLKSEESMKVIFFTRNIIRRCVLSPHPDQAPLFIQEIISPVVRRWIDIPKRCFLEDQEWVKTREIDALNRLGIPEEKRSIIVKEVNSKANEMITKNGDGGMEIIVGIGVVKFESLEYREYEEREYDENRRRAELESMELIEAKTIPATKSSIEALVKLMIHDTTDCAVCKEEIEANTEAMQMPCHHFYHQHCIVRWLQTSHMCPLCRYKMPPQLD